MAGAETQELGKLGKRKANTGDLGDGPSSLPSLSSFGRVKGHMTDGGGIGDCTAEIGGGEELEVAAAEESLDPLVVFGSGIMMMILSKLDARSVAIARLVSNGWLEVASADKIWAPKLDFGHHGCIFWTGLKVLLLQTIIFLYSIPRENL